MNRREMLHRSFGLCSAATVSLYTAEGVSEVDLPFRTTGMVSCAEEHWRQLDSKIREWWDQDLISATEDAVRNDAEKATLFLPFPYVKISAGSSSIVRWQFPVDAAFMNYALFAHGRLDIVRNHILNHLFMIERYGFPLNANLTEVDTRSQTPFFVPPTIWRYYSETKDKDILEIAYPLLKREYEHYWKAQHHQTPVGLATNRDLGDPDLSAVLAAEAEVLDWMPVFGGDVRRCVPISTNVGLVGHARVLAQIARELGIAEDAAVFADEAGQRLSLINRYCWNEKAGLFLEYDYVSRKQLPYVSEFSWWTLWFGVATPSQAQRLVRNLRLIEKTFGISVTDKAYPDPHTAADYELKNQPFKRIQELPPPAGIPPAYVGGNNPMQWMYPAGWGTTQIIIVGGLLRYSYDDAARRISTRFLRLALDQYDKTGELWEKYNVVDGTLVLPNARYGNIPQHSFTAAAVVLLGQLLFEKKKLLVGCNG
jgi:alpha,alpha-trehalase